MTEPYTGGCACGAIRYEIHGVPRIAFHCQCRDCQYDSGTGHGSHLGFGRAKVIMTGVASERHNFGDKGRRKSRGFCPDCGTPVCLTFPEEPDRFTVSAASLDDASRFEPTFIVWTASAPNWDHLDPKLPRFEKMPGG